MSEEKILYVELANWDVVLLPSVNQAAPSSCYSSTTWCTNDLETIDLGRELCQSYTHRGAAIS